MATAERGWGGEWGSSTVSTVYSPSWLYLECVPSLATGSAELSLSHLAQHLTPHLQAHHSHPWLTNP